MSNCAVVTCKTSRRNAAVLTTGAEVSLHRFPTDPKLKVKWVNATGRTNWTPSKHSAICSLHFTESCFVKGIKKRRLIQNALPTVGVRGSAINYEDQESDSPAGDDVMNASSNEEPVLLYPQSSSARFNRMEYVTTNPDTESIIKTERSDDFLTDAEPTENDAKANVCVACLRRVTSQPVIGRLWVTYHALCGDVMRVRHVTLCRLCRRLLLNVHRFREQCRAAAAVLTRVGKRQNVTDDHRRSINLHLNLTTVHNSPFSIITIKHKTRDVITKTTENSTKTTENSTKTTKNVKMDASKTTESVEIAQVGTFEGAKSEHMATPADEDPWKPLWMEVDGTDIMSDDSDKSRAISEKSIAKISKLEQERKITTKIRISKSQRKLDAASRRPKALELNQDVMKTVTLRPHELMDFLNARKQTATYMKAVLKCDMCYKTFSTKQAHESHMYNHTNKRGDITCDICKLRFNQKCRLRDHIIKHLYKYKCTKCNFQSQHITAARQHINVHEDIKWRCEKCNTRYRHKSTYLTHVRIHHPSKSTICQLCGYSFINRQGLHSHNMKMHRMDVRKVPEDGPFCTMCETRFVDEEAYQKHMKVTACSSNTRAAYNQPRSMRWKGNCEKILTALRFYATGCYQQPIGMQWGNSMSQKSVSRVIRQVTLAINHRLLRKYIKFPMTVNQRQLAKQIFINAPQPFPDAIGAIDCTHINILAPRIHEEAYVSGHHEGHSLNVQACGKELPSYSDYQRHFKTEHPDDKMEQIRIRYLCYVCGKKFQSAALLNDHILLHEPTAATAGYTCEECGKSYLTPMRLAIHSRIHSGIRYACRKCGREFNVPNNRDRHEKFAHTDEKKVKCDFCDKMFKSNEYKKTHESFVHLNRPYKKRNWREERERRSKVEGK